MRYSTGLSAAVLGLAQVVSGSALALEVNSPADVPPSGYSGRQFVDSEGCVFVRAGVGTAVNWVARVDRNGVHLCGYQPTFGASATAVAPAPAPAQSAPAASAPMPTIALTSAPPPVGLTPRPVVAVAPVASAAPATPRPAAEAVPGAYVSPYAVPMAGAGAAPLPTIVEATTVTNAQSVCPNLSPVAQRYMLSDGRHVVRCGPQTSDPVGYINGAGVPGLQVAGSTSQFAAVPVARTGSAPQVAMIPPIPAGYAPAWDDDRLNPYRGVSSASGPAQMARLWTDTVPARMVPVAVDNSYSAPLLQVAYSGKSSATDAPLPAASARLVQVGTYLQPANAEAARGVLRALGLAVQNAHVVQGGRNYQVVYAGPFASADALAAALAAARSAGFSDAFAR
ncbi:SPOR domain-containing protein [Phaeovulum sp.]|uniref:SPOR domain-containing protein n=1 Tax=Phaeovulum sp. TaxID=2934796 RepID=UPI0035634D4C